MRTATHAAALLCLCLLAGAAAAQDFQPMPFGLPAAEPAPAIATTDGGALPDFLVPPEPPPSMRMQAGAAPMTVIPTPEPVESAVPVSGPIGPLVLITPAEVKQALNERIPLALVDVRSELVRAIDGHIPGDVHIPFEPRQTFVARLAQRVDRRLPVVLYCHDGIWSAQAGEAAMAAGFKPYLMGAYRLW